MSYEAIRYFIDLQDDNKAYEVGDVFPRKGLDVSEERLKELLSDENKQKTPVIKEVAEKTDAPKKSVRRKANNSAAE